MYDTNLWIIDELFSKLEELRKNKKYFTKATDFTRDCVFKFEVLFSIISNLPRRSLSIEITEAINVFNEILNEKKEGTKSGFCKARKKIKHELFKYISQYLVALFYVDKNAKRIKRWKGFILVGIDGSLMDLVDTPDVKEFFGAGKNQFNYQVQGRVMLAFDVLNKQIIKSTLENCHKSEIEIAKDWVATIGTDNLCIYDRLFPSLSLLFLHDNNKVPYVMRCKLGFNNYVKAFMKSNKNEMIQEWEITTAIRRELEERGVKIKRGAKIKVRLIKLILSTGEVEILLTSLLDKKNYPRKLFKELYFKRWGVETQFGFLKNTLQLELISGRSVESILQDFYGTIIRSNIQSLIELDCAKKVKKKGATRKLDYQINHSIAAGMMKAKMPQLLFGENRKAIFEELILLFVKHLEPIRNDRQLPRIKKSNKKSGKYRPLKNYKKIA
jgi:Transposase DDE domain.